MNICKIHRKYLYVQLGAMEVDANPGKQHRCVSEELLRGIMNVKWPWTICNKSLYAPTEMKPWSINIQRKRLIWFGHLMRLSSKTPARKVFNAFINSVIKPPERQKTWVSQVLKEIKLLTNLPLKDDITKNIEILEVE